MKKLIFDRGFIDGPTVSRFKSDYGIDTIFPLKEGMLDLRDARVLARIDGEPWVEWRPPPKRKSSPPAKTKCSVS